VFLRTGFGGGHFGSIKAKYVIEFYRVFGLLSSFLWSRKEYEMGDKSGNRVILSIIYH
jgi:hypothetical protein